VSEQSQRTIRIKWVRSGIGFSYHQKRVVRSLGLKRLNQEVERPDTPQIRGLVAKVPHLVEIVEATSPAAWTSVPEYTIYPPAAAPSKPSEATRESPAEETEKTETPSTRDVVARDQSEIPRSARNDTGASAAAESATDTSGDLTDTKVSEPAGPSGEESVATGDEASPGKGQPKA
jgi:large subunit ribosomal protein L30